MEWKNPVVPGLLKGKFLLVRPQKSLVRDVGLWDLIIPALPGSVSIHLKDLSITSRKESSKLKSFCFVCFFWPKFSREATVARRDFVFLQIASFYMGVFSFFL